MTLLKGTTTKRNANNVIYLIRGRSDLPALVGDTTNTDDPLMDQFKILLLNISDDLRLDAPGTDFEVLKDTLSPIGRHLSLMQTINGIAVFGSHIRIQTDGNKVVQVRVGRHLDRTGQQILTREEDDEELSSREILNIITQNIGDETAP